MGLSNNKTKIETAPFPTGTPEEISAAGQDLKVAHSCAVPIYDGRGSHILRGCMYAETCHLLFGGRNPRLGTFGPKSKVPGTAGEGPENVAYAIKSVEGDYKEDFMPCHRLISSLFGRLIASASRMPDDPKSETVRILGGPGTKIYVEETIPEDPVICNRNGNSRMVTTPEVIVVPKHLRPKDIDPRAQYEFAQTQADTDSFLQQVAGESIAANTPGTSIEDDENDENSNE